jgi:glyoxylase-like metal-dependent hydrolase (beta-lactamase superfamily II)/rhodanese-related sulfurtransferase
MDNKELIVSSEELRRMLENNEPVVVLDVRPRDQRDEWQIPGSHYLDAYKRLNEGDYSVLDELDIPENTKVVAVCAAGRTSKIASAVLQKKGIEAYSLEGGMKGWSLAWNVANKEFDGFGVLQVRRTGKGCLSYIVFSNNEAIIVDASLPLEVYKKLVRERNLTVKYVLETHIHADHLSRSKQVADYFHAPLFLPWSNKVQFQYNEIKDGAEFSIGAVKLRAIPTPGHTPESVSFYFANTVILTGDTIFTNGIGRPDLKSNEGETRKKAALLYDSLKNLLLLPDETLILPAHANRPAGFNHELIFTTISEAKKDIPLLQGSQSDFINYLLQNLPPTPPNYLAIVEKNIKGDFNDINPVDLEAGANRCAIS